MNRKWGDRVRAMFSKSNSHSAALPVGMGLSPQQKIYAVGDIHGCRDLLMSLLDQIGDDFARDSREKCEIVFLGDYVDRGSDSRGVLDILTNFPSDLPPHVCLMGNHEEVLLQFLEAPSVFDEWRRFGGMETLLSYGVARSALLAGEDPERARDVFQRAIGEEISNWLRSLPTCCQRGPYFFCHAGVRPGRPLSLQSARDLLWGDQDFLAWRQPFEKIIVHGHTPVEEPELLPNRVNVDTGAFLSGRLTAAVLTSEGVSTLSTK